MRTSNFPLQSHLCFYKSDLNRVDAGLSLFYSTHYIGWPLLNEYKDTFTPRNINNY